MSDSKPSRGSRSSSMSSERSCDPLTSTFDGSDPLSLLAAEAASETMMDPLSQIVTEMSNVVRVYCFKCHILAEAIVSLSMIHNLLYKTVY